MADVGTIEQVYLFAKVGTINGSQNWSETSFHSTTATGGRAPAA